MTREFTARRGCSRECSRECRRSYRRGFLCAFLAITLLTLLVERSPAQAGGYERSFAESKATVEKILKDMPFALGGRLPTLDGFALPGDRPLDRFQKAYFQSTVQVSTTASG